MNEPPPLVLATSKLPFGYSCKELSVRSAPQREVFLMEGYKAGSTACLRCEVGIVFRFFLSARSAPQREVFLMERYKAGSTACSRFALVFSPSHSCGPTGLSHVRYLGGLAASLPLSCEMSQSSPSRLSSNRASAS